MMEKRHPAFGTHACLLSIPSQAAAERQAAYVARRDAEQLARRVQHLESALVDAREPLREAPGCCGLLAALGRGLCHDRRRGGVATTTAQPLLPLDSPEGAPGRAHHGQL